jgi:hypothetical protein
LTAKRAIYITDMSDIERRDSHFTQGARDLPEYVFTVLHRICIVASRGIVTTYMGLVKKPSLPTGPPADVGVHDPDNSLVSGRSFSGLPRENGSVQKQDRV